MVRMYLFFLTQSELFMYGKRIKNDLVYIEENITHDFTMEQHLSLKYVLVTINKMCSHI